jgi:hypothetical protein
MKTREKYEEYAALMLLQINEMFDEDCENHIDLDEVSEGDNANHFTHALSTLMPMLMIGRLTGNKLDPLEMNYMANRLASQFMNFTKKDK